MTRFCQLGRLANTGDSLAFDGRDGNHPPMVVRVLSPLVLCFLAACISSPQTVTHSAAAGLVRIQKHLPPAEELEPVGEVSCEVSGNWGTLGANIASCRNDLRNKAHAKSATIVVVDSEHLGSGACSNCVVMYGTAYRKRDQPTEQEPEQEASFSGPKQPDFDGWDD